MSHRKQKKLIIWNCIAESESASNRCGSGQESLHNTSNLNNIFFTRQELATMLIQDKIEHKQELRRRIEENRKRKEEREKAAEVYQVVRNPNKIKKLKRKDLVKRDILGKVQA